MDFADQNYNNILIFSKKNIKISFLQYIKRITAILCFTFYLKYVSKYFCIKTT